MLQQRLMSIDIGTDRIKIVVGKFSNNRISIDHAVSVQTPPNAIQDGQVTDISKLKDIIGSVLREHHIQTKKVVVTLESTSIITRELYLPAVKPKEVLAMLGYEIQQYFPTTLDEYVIQHKELEIVEEGNLKKIRIAVAALPKMIVQNYLELIKSLGLKPIALDIHSNAISKLFDENIMINSKTIQEHQTIALIDIGYANINVNIMDKGIPQFNRLLTIGGKDIPDMFNADLMDMVEKKMGLSHFSDEHGPLSDLAKDLTKAAIDGWLEEIQRIFKYYTSRNPGNKVDKILLFGGYSNLDGIREIMENYFNIPASKIESIGKLRINNRITNFQLENNLNAIGAIIRRKASV